MMLPFSSMFVLTQENVPYNKEGSLPSVKNLLEANVEKPAFPPWDLRPILSSHDRFLSDLIVI